MPDIPTQDPDVIIEVRSIDDLNPINDFVVYRNKKIGERWRIDGRCNRCGLCEVGRVKPNPIIFNPLIKIGDSEACTDTSIEFRSDVPSRPEMPAKMKAMRDAELAKGNTDYSTIGECTLSGYYL